jgi:hypothetical protein
MDVKYTNIGYRLFSREEKNEKVVNGDWIGRYVVS